MDVSIDLPEAETEQQALYKLVSAAHAQAVIEMIRALECPPRRKKELLDAVICRLEQPKP